MHLLWGGEIIPANGLDLISIYADWIHVARITLVSTPSSHQRSLRHPPSPPPGSSHLVCDPAGLSHLLLCSISSSPLIRQFKTMASDAFTSTPSTSQPSSSGPPVSDSSGDKAPKKKMKFIVEVDGSVVGEFSKQWNSRTGDFVRIHIPICYRDWRRVPKNFKDDVWTSLMEEFELNVPPNVARPFIEKSWPHKFRTYKTSLRALLNIDDPLGAEPMGIDPHIWRKFVQNESDSRTKELPIKNSENRKMLKFSHCLGRCTYAQKQYLLEQEHPEKEMGRLEKWYVAHERRDRNVLESARSKYDELKALEKKRKSTSLSGEDNSNTCRDLDSDEIAEVFGKDTNGRVRAVSSYISRKQLIHVGVAKATNQQNKKANEEVTLVKDAIIQVNARLGGLEGFMHGLLHKLSNGKENAPQMVTTPTSELGSNSVRHPSHLCQNLNNVFTTIGVSQPPQSRPSPTENPPVILVDKYGNELAKGHVVTDETAGVCHFKTVGLGEKKVYVEEVIDPNAPLWDPPQGCYDTLAGYVQGGFLIWLECWLKYV